MHSNFQTTEARTLNKPEPEIENGVRADRGVDDAYRRFAVSYKAGDVAALINVYRQDARYFFPDNKLYYGRGQIRELYTTFFDNARKANEILIPTFTIKDREKFGNLSCDVGNFTVRVFRRGEPVRQVDGNFVFVLRKVSGEWQIQLQAYNGTGTKKRFVKQRFGNLAKTKKPKPENRSRNRFLS